LSSGRDRAARYFAYGIGISSAVPLPELSLIAPPPDASVRFAPAARLRARRGSRGVSWRAGPKEVSIAWPRVGLFRIGGGREIVVHPAPGVDESLLRLVLLGPALAILLHQRGRLVFHASAVAREGRAFGFLGGSGRGKSTLAAALHALGDDLVADDALVVSDDEPAPEVSPGFPQLKLWPDSARLLGEDLPPRLHPRVDKRALRLPRGFAARPLPLGGLFVLARGARPSAERLPPVEALAELLRHTYGARLILSFDARRQMRRCASLLAKVPAYRLTLPRSLPSLGDGARFVHDRMTGEPSMP